MGIRHYVVGNLPGVALWEGKISAGDELWPDSVPRINDAGSHRYGFFLFAQPSKQKIPFEPFKDQPARWDYAAFLTKYGIPAGRKLASNYMILMYDGTQDVPPSEALGLSGK